MKSTIIALIGLLALSLAGQAQVGFVKRENGQFRLNGKPYYFVGTNYWYSVPLALQGKKGKDRIRKELDFLRKQGISNLRILVGAEGSGLENGVERVGPPLQPQKGVYDDRILESLDFVLAEMGKREIFAVLYLSNNWEWSGGFLQYLNWNGQIADTTLRKKMLWGEQQEQTAKFYSCLPCKEGYKKQVAHIIGHYNKITGKYYRDEPTIMAWELGNEPRPMEKSAVADYENWVSDASAFIRSQDRHHLITTGIEGDMGTESMDVYEKVHADKNIDYLTIHIWPKNWGWFQDTAIAASMTTILDNTKDYIQKHQVIAEQLQKPLVLEEFGLPRDQHSFDRSTPTTSRDHYFRIVLDLWNANRKKGGVLAGCNFWSYGGLGKTVKGQAFWKQGDDYTGDPPQEEQGLNSVFNADTSTWKVIHKVIFSK